MANTKITADNLAANAVTASSIADNSIGIDQLNVSDGTNGQVLTTNGSGTLSFSTISSTPTSIADADADTKIQVEESSDEDVIRFDVGGTEYMTLTSNGKLNVTEIAHISSGSLEIGNGDEKQIFDASGATIQFQTADTERMRIDSSGLVRIGASGGTGQRLSINGFTQSDTMSEANAWLVAEANGGDGIAIGTRATTPYATWIQSGYLNTLGTSNHYALALNPYGGSVGIGITSPSGELHVESGQSPTDIYFTNTALSGTGYDVTINALGSANNSEMKLNLGLLSDADRDQIKAYQGNLFFRANNDQRYQITSAGRHVFWGTHQGDSTGHFMFTNQGFDSATTNNSLVVQNGNTFIQIMAWTSNGARIGTRVGGWSTTGAQVTYLVSADATFAYGSGSSFYLANGTAITSDERLKKNIVSTPDGQLAKINALRPVSFDWKDERKDSGEGFIAQEVEAIIPEAVAESEYAPDPDDDTRDFEGDVKSIKDGVLLSRLVKAVQELSAELDAAKARITELENA